MDINELIPPVLQPYKAYIVLAELFIVYIVRPSMPAPAADSKWYLFIYNVINALAGQYGKAAVTVANLPPSETAKLKAAP